MRKLIVPSLTIQKNFNDESAVVKIPDGFTDIYGEPVPTNLDIEGYGVKIFKKQ